MRMIILGSGTAVPSLTRSAPAYYLEDEGRQVLIDCGGGSVPQLLRAGIDYRDIDAVFITHTHPDHVAGLLPLIHGLVATPLYQREKELLLAGPGGWRGYWSNHVASLFRKTRLSFIRTVEIRRKMHYPPFRILTAPTVHVGNSIAFRFESNGRSVVFTGDADYDQRIIELSRGADILVADCAFPGGMKQKGHMTPEECGMVAQQSGVQKLILSHLHPLPVPDSEKLEECRNFFEGHVSLAEDLMELTLP